MKPVKTSTNPKRLLKIKLKKAILYSLSLRRLSVSRANVEKVVYPPRMPTKRKMRIEGETGRRSKAPQNSPIRKEPDRLTTNVPKGKTPWEYL
jgi:hypothetical protein